MNWLKRLFQPKRCHHQFARLPVYGKAFHVPGPTPITVGGHRIDGYTKIPHTFKTVCLSCGEVP